MMRKANLLFHLSRLTGLGLRILRQPLLPFVMIWEEAESDTDESSRRSPTGARRQEKDP